MYRLHQSIAALVKFQFQFSFQGKDDLRQDAVMQQVFTLLNTLLKNNKETQNRKLLIRTYKVSGFQ
jgi:phosphatidylinositol kinase/protein kinase (PI-3  family)